MARVVREKTKVFTGNIGINTTSGTDISNSLNQISSAASNASSAFFKRADEIAQTRKTLEDNFGSLTNALEKITAIKSNDPATIALQKVRKSTDSFQRIMEKHQQDLATINPLTGAVRKQRFKRPYC